MHYLDQPMKQRSDIHLARKIWHMCGVLLMAAIYYFVERDTALQIASAVTLFFVSLDITRQQMPKLNTFSIKLFKPFMRENERHQIAGLSYMLLGVLIIIFLFSKKVVILSLLFLAIGDPLASFIGINFGKDKLIGEKSLQGSLAAFFVCTLIAAFYFRNLHLMTERILIVSVLSGLVGAIAELVPIGKLDDNFTFPVLSATLLSTLFHLFGGS